MKFKSRAFKFTITIVLLFAAWVLCAPYFAENLIVEKPLERADAILILAGSSVYIERTNKAAEIFRAGIAPKIILTDDGERTGWSRGERRNVPYVELARRNLVERGVPAENIEIITPVGSGTIYEAQVFRGKARAENWKTVLLITSAYHARRAFWTFDRVFADKTIEFGIVSPLPGEQTPPPDRWWLVPSGWRFVAGEYLKGVYYWVYY